MEVAQRIIDFVSGAAYSMDGNLQRISNYIFIVTPNSVELSGDFQDMLAAGDVSRYGDGRYDHSHLNYIGTGFAEAAATGRILFPAAAPVFLFILHKIQTDQEELDRMKERLTVCRMEIPFYDICMETSL